MNIGINWQFRVMDCNNNASKSFQGYKISSISFRITMLFFLSSATIAGVFKIEKNDILIRVLGRFYNAEQAFECKAT
jgi:hypothetical protein